MESSSQKTISAESSRSDMEYNISKKRKRNKSQSFFTEEFKKDKPPTFGGEIKKIEEFEACLFSLTKYF
jgi:hypothetical protein